MNLIDCLLRRDPDVGQGLRRDVAARPLARAGRVLITGGSRFDTWRAHQNTFCSLSSEDCPSPVHLLAKTGPSRRTADSPKPPGLSGGTVASLLARGGILPSPVSVAQVQMALTDVLAPGYLPGSCAGPR